MTGDPDPSNGRRRAPRRVTQVEAIVIPISPFKQQPRLVMLQDVSARGASLLLPSAGKPGDQLQMVLPRSRTDHCVLLCEIVHVREATGGQFATGIEFTCISSLADAKPKIDPELVNRVAQAVLA